MVRQQMDKKFDLEYMTIRKKAETGPSNKLSNMFQIVEILASLRIFKFDKNGNVLRNKRGKRRVDWLHILRTLWKLVASLAYLQDLAGVRPSSHKQ